MTDSVLSEILKMGLTGLGSGGAMVLIVLFAAKKMGLLRTAEERWMAKAGDNGGVKSPHSTGGLLAASLMARLDLVETATAHRARSYHDLAAKLHAEGIEAQKQIQARYSEDAKVMASAIRTIEPASNNLMHVANKLAAISGRLEK